ncbi:MAG TPA: hypothetical protein VFF06_31295 [Polyangia bacterium]|nr:hypothetical protein [Polyangia bacterium]
MKTIAILAVLIAAPSVARATETLTATQPLDFDRPESWAMKYFTTATIPSGMGPPRPLKLGQLRISLEGGWIPAVSDEQATVGFNGTKREDLNKLPAIGWLRFTVGLPWRFSFMLSYLPPIPINGVQGNLFTLGLGRPFRITRDLTLGVAAYGQLGSVEGAFTCPESAVRAGGDPQRNPFGCITQSHDEVDMNYFGMQASASYRIRPAHGLEPYATAAFNYMDLAFHVDARYGDVIDDTTLKTTGVTFSTSTGLIYPVTRRIDLGAEVFYSPLTVQRPMQRASTVEGFLNVRAMVAFRLF